VMIRDFTSSDFFLSLGVGPDVSWDEEVAPIGSGIHLYDDTVAALPRPVDGAVFYREHVAPRPGPGLVTLGECVRRAPTGCDLILKMDIEGSEWAVLAAADPADLARCRQIAVECHGLMTAVTQRDRFTQVLAALRRIHETHEPIAVHPNNHGNFQVLANVPVPDVVEVSYARRSDYRLARPERAAAAALMRASYPGYPDIVIAFPVPVVPAVVDQGRPVGDGRAASG